MMKDKSSFGLDVGINDLSAASAVVLIGGCSCQGRRLQTPLIAYAIRPLANEPNTSRLLTSFAR